jgi:transposase InsO family protein
MSKKHDWAKVGDIVEKIRKLGLPYSEGAKRFGINLGLLYEYNRKVNREAREKAASGGEEKGADEKKKEVTAAPGFPEEVKELIRDYRRKNPAHGFKRIADLLKQNYLVVVTRKQVRKVLKEAGLLETCDSSFDKEVTPKGTRRFEAKRPGEIWQMDVAYVYIKNTPVLYLVVIIDDHSRFCLSAELRRDQCADTLIAVLHDACSAAGPPKKLMTDQGSGFYSWSQEETRFQEYLDEEGIEHLVAEPHSPQTQGKVERLIQSIRTELLRKVKFTGFSDAQEQIRAYVHSYNFDRPNQGINGKRPADRFHGVAREIDLVESALAREDLDPSRGYVVYKVHGRSVTAVNSAEGLQIFLDGKLLKEAAGNE